MQGWPDPTIMAAALAAALATPAAGATQTGAHTRALAAGYKAAFLCSDLFDAGESVEQATADDLEGIYPQYQAAVRALPAQVDRRARTVSVAFDPRLPPRIAAWRPALGCAQLPIGAQAAATRALPRMPLRPPDHDALAWPAGDISPPAHETAALNLVLARASDGRTYGAGTRTTAVLVTSARRILAERYRAGFDAHRPQRTWSAAKSLTATLIGRAVQLGLLDVNAPADIPEWRAPGDPRAQITLAELTHMASGLWTDGPGNRTDSEYLRGAAVTESATAMPLEAAPGSRWRYANNDALLAARALRARLGDRAAALEFPFVQLLWKIGMTRTTPETDWRGDFVLSSQVWSTARDLARLGILYLDDGVWDGERLLPADWPQFVATPAPAQPASAAAGAPGYGAFFWLWGPAQGLPAGTYAMEGNRGQYVFIVPARGLVVVRRGYDAETSARFDAARFVRDVLAAAR